MLKSIQSQIFFLILWGRALTPRIRRVSDLPRTFTTLIEMVRKDNVPKQVTCCVKSHLRKKINFSREHYNVMKQTPCSRNGTRRSSTVTRLIVSLPSMSVPTLWLSEIASGMVRLIPHIPNQQKLLCARAFLRIGRQKANNMRIIKYCFIVRGTVICGW
jgi:hypothetical protein